MNSIKVCEYSRSFHDDLILQDQASGERSQDQWSSGWLTPREVIKNFSCSAQLRLKFILHIYVKVPTVVGILTFISRINYRLW